MQLWFNDISHLLNRAAARRRRLSCSVGDDSKQDGVLRPVSSY